MAISKLNTNPQRLGAVPPPPPPPRPPLKLVPHELPELKSRLSLIGKYGPILIPGQADLFTQIQKLSLITLPTAFAQDPAVTHEVDFILNRMNYYNQGSAKKLRPVVLENTLKEIEAHAKKLIKIYRSYPSPETMAAEESILNNLSRHSLFCKAEDVIAALSLLETKGMSNVRRKYITILLSNSKKDIIGAIGELKYILELDRTAEILDAKVDCWINGLKIEFFDIIARDRATGKLILVERKCDSGYTLADLAHQLFGFGNDKNPNADLKDVSQFDAILQPEKSTLSKNSRSALYLQDVISGNYEIRVVTHRDLSSLTGFNGSARNLAALLTDLAARASTLLSLSGLPKQLTPEKLHALFNIRKQQIADNPHLQNVKVKFEVCSL